jgi:hypothetical protein
MNTIPVMRLVIPGVLVIPEKPNVDVVIRFWKIMTFLFYVLDVIYICVIRLFAVFLILVVGFGRTYSKSLQ